MGHDYNIFAMTKIDGATNTILEITKVQSKRYTLDQCATNNKKKGMFEID